VSKGKGKTREEIINNLAERIDKFERYANPHSQAMADMALHLANRLGLSQADAKAIAEAARLHDIGLYTMSPAYHATAAALRFTERLDLWRHSIIGEQEMAKREASRYAQLLVR
jgi:HD-GYP domain-containing protein (c-di-GMP phosphodiesterase class II)